MNSKRKWAWRFSQAQAINAATKKGRIILLIVAVVLVASAALTVSLVVKAQDQKGSASGQTTRTLREFELDQDRTGPRRNLPEIPEPDSTDEGIKIAITQYFEWLSRAETEGALSALSFKPLTTTPESQAFLNDKSDLLQVIDYSNQLYGVKITNRAYELSFGRTSFDMEGIVAEVEVAERFNRKYAYFTEAADGEIVHTIKLHNNGGQWEIIDDTLLNASDAPPNKVHKAALMEDIRSEAEFRRATEQYFLLTTGITEKYLSSEREQLAKQGLDPLQIEERLTLIVNEKMNTASEQLTYRAAPDETMPQMNVNRTYNRAAAKRYIDKWHHGQNPDWGDFGKLDCTNWVSQIINAGGVPEDKTGSYQWYWDNMKAPRTSAPYTRSSSWAGVKELWDYVQGNTKNNGPNGPQGESWTNSKGFTQVTTGDFIQLKDGSGWFHTYGVYDGTWVNLRSCWWKWCSDDWRYKVRVTSHSGDRHRDDFDTAASSYPTRRYVHITGWYKQ